MSDDNIGIVDAAKLAAKWMKQWLDDDLCDCGDIHICGRIERIKELRQIEKAIQAVTSHDK